MCSAFSFVYVVLFLSAAAGGLVAALYEGKFASRLSANHPGTWRTITARKMLFNDGDQDGAATVLYLWSGGYRELDDVTLNSYATRVFAAMALFVLALVGSLLMGSVAPDISLLACFHR
ncbi:MAG: hypothetical protein Q8R67_07465 [Rhodoferax sp.]|nr:hypothetical protein [Rhodoferax sp.]MDP3651504.1 hypothetical protein [Rhodoferax sp.]